MKIAYITPDYLPHIGGIEKYVNSLAVFFQDAGNEVVVITADRNIKNIEQNLEDGIKVLRFPVYSFSGILFLKKKKFLENLTYELKDVDIVHLNDCKFLYKYLARHKTYKLFLSSHGFIFHTTKHKVLKEKFFKSVVVKNQRFYDKIICVSDQDACIAEKYGLTNVSIILPGVDIHKFECEKKDGLNAELQFVYWGRLARNKGIAECLIKLAELKDKFLFYIAGICEDAIYMEELLKIIKNNDLGDKVHFLGYKNDTEIKDLIKTCDFILMPSLHEGFGMTLAESLLSHRNIIAHSNASFSKILEQAEAKDFLFDFTSASSKLQDKINDLVNSTVIPKNVEQFSQETMFKNILQLYRNDF